MRPRWIAVGAALVAVVAVAAYFVWRPTDESRIRTQLTRLAAAVHITDADAQANPMARLAHVNGEMEGLFEPEARVNVPVKLDAGHTTAFVQATANVKAVERDGSASQDRRAVDVHFVAKDGAWAIRTLSVWTKEDAPQ